MNKSNSGRLYTRLIRLGRQDDAAFLLRFAIARNAAANDNVPVADGMGVDSEMVMRPTVEEIRRASIPVRDGKASPDGEIGLRFDSKGKLTEYRAAAEDGTPLLNKEGGEFWLKPIDGYKKPKGSRRKTSKALAVDNNAHGSWLLSLRGLAKMPAKWIPDTRYPSFGVDFDLLKAMYDKFLRRAQKSENRDYLAWHDVDGPKTLEQCRVANPRAIVTRCKPGMAWKVDFLCGKPDVSGTATEGSFVGAPDAAETTMISAMDANAAKVGAALDMAMAGSTFREIAAAHGHNDNKGGEEWAVRAVDREIVELKKSAA